MSFGSPGYLAFLAAVPAILIGAGVWLRWRAAARRRFGAGAIPALPGVAWFAVLGLGALAVTFAALAAARPQIGTHTVRLEQRGIDAVVVLDVSTSMLARDTQPTRLARAQAEINALLDRMHGDHIGLVIFARQPFVRSPLTSDTTALRSIVAGVGEERVLVDPGSDLGSAIAAGTRLLNSEQSPGKAMIVVSDGEDHGAGVAPAVTQAAAAGIRVYAAGVGTAEGAPVRDIDPATSQAHDRIGADGRPVLTHLDAEALASIAAGGGGRYIELSGEDRRLASLASELHGLTATTFGSEENPQRVERFRAFAAVALALTLASFAVPAVLRGGADVRRIARALPVLGAALFAGAICTASVADINRRGNGAYDAGRFGDAVSQYQTAEAIDPARPELYHNAGNAYDRDGDLDRAIEETRRALDRVTANPSVEPRAEYALGNHFAAKQALEDAREAYRRSLLADPGDADAKHNLEIIEQRLHPTPTPSPTPTPGAPQGTPEAADTTAEAGQLDATAQAAATARSAPPGGTPSPSDQPLTQQEAERQLAEALRGIDRELTEEEARRVLDLLDRTNRAANEQQGQPGTGAVDDY